MNRAEFALVLAMAGKTTNSRAAWALSRAQHGLITRRQLGELGFTKSGIEHRTASGRLHRVARGVYAVGWPQMTPKRRWMTAVLACGEGAMLSHRSAGALWGIGSERIAQVQVTVPRRLHQRADRGRGRKSTEISIRVICRPSLGESERTRRDGIPVTSVVRTLLDLAVELRPRALERAVNEADKHDLIEPGALRAALDGHRGTPGVRNLRKLLDPEAFRLTDSDLETRFRPIAAAAGLPPPLTKRLVNGFEVDFHWPELGLVVETDGLRYHRTASAQARDRMRDQAHTAAGLTQLRFTHWQIENDPEHVYDILRKTATGLR